MRPAARARTSPAPGGPARVPMTDRDPPVPRSGDVLEVTRDASVQFANPMLFRVIRVHDWPTYTGWVWLDGYQLDDAGEAKERRSIFVQAHGLRRVIPPGGRPRSGRRPSPTPPVTPK